jgi:aspartokinase
MLPIVVFTGFFGSNFNGYKTKIGRKGTYTVKTASIARASCIYSFGCKLVDVEKP